MQCKTDYSSHVVLASHICMNGCFESAIDACSCIGMWVVCSRDGDLSHCDCDLDSSQLKSLY